MKICPGFDLAIKFKVIIIIINGITSALYNLLSSQIAIPGLIELVDLLFWSFLLKV